MEANFNGTTQEIAGGYNQRLAETQQDGLGQLPNPSSSYGAESFPVSIADSTGENSLGAITIQGDTNPGKILQRLEYVEQSHLDYVRAHQTRLEARLDESKKLEENFRQSVEELRQEIYKLVRDSENTDNAKNGNGHYAI